MTLFVLALLALVFLGCAYAGRAFIGALAAAALGVWLFGADWPAGLRLGAIAAVVVAALVFGVRPLRAALFGRPLLGLMRGILPRMSDTERVALEAGTVWWDGRALLRRRRPGASCSTSSRARAHGARARLPRRTGRRALPR